MTFSAKKRFFEAEVPPRPEPAAQKPAPEPAVSAGVRTEMRSDNGTETETAARSETGTRTEAGAEHQAKPVPSAERQPADDRTSDSGEPAPEAAAGSRRVLTAKAERRLRERLADTASHEEHQMSPAEWRALQAEKRAAWRQARLKSLEQDALQAQIVIRKMSELIEGPEPSAKLSAELAAELSALETDGAGSPPPDNGNDAAESGAEDDAVSPSSQSASNDKKKKRRRKKR